MRFAYERDKQLQKGKVSNAATCQSLAKWLRENDPVVVKQTVNAYARFFQPAPFVPDKEVENVMKDLANRRSIPKEFEGRPKIFRDNGPLERALRVKK
jgi:hypothetical protein